ncbi:MAG TPA: hypothetical protein PLE61_05355 [Vicinamibacterales bacterium]|nr:hypothetical protein [Vicinamibacterales bacterium]
MNVGRLAASAIVGWMAYLATSALVADVLLADLHARHAELFRPAGEAHTVIGLGAALAGFFVFAYGYAKGYEGGPGALEGLRYGMVVGLLLVCFSVVWAWAALSLSGAIAAAWIVDTLVEMSLYGAIVGLVYAPGGSRK